MIDQISETWNINNRVNLSLLGAISDEGLDCTLSKHGGRIVAMQFAHMHYVRLYRFMRYAKDLMAGQTHIRAGDSVDRTILKKRLIESADAMTKWMVQAADEGGRIKGFKRGVIPMLGYLIAHEAHHRGSIMLTIQQCGYNVPQSVQNGIWAWNQI